MEALEIVPALLLAGCMAPNTDEPFQARPEYPVWYLDIEGCAGAHGSYDALRFFYLPDDDPRAGVTKGTTIWLRYPDSFSRLIVEHEMLHSLIGDGSHQDPRWVRCGVAPAQLRAILGASP